jgi:AcrR family transcriptional regulator
MPKISEAVRSARRQDLVDAAWRCIARKGWSDLTVDDVCAEAGVSKGSFYSYFTRKKDLLVALAEDEAAQLDDLLVELRSRTLPAAEQLRRYARTLLERATDPARVQVRADLWAAMSTDPAVRERFAAAVARRRSGLRQLIDTGIEAGQLQAVPANALASILLALTEGLVLHRGLDPTAFRWANVYRALDALLDGVRRG